MWWSVREKRIYGQAILCLLYDGVMLTAYRCGGLSMTNGHTDKQSFFFNKVVDCSPLLVNDMVIPRRAEVLAGEDGGSAFFGPGRRQNSTELLTGGLSGPQVEVSPGSKERD